MMTSVHSCKEKIRSVAPPVVHPCTGRAYYIQMLWTFDVAGSSPHRQGICIVLQKSVTKICPCVDGRCDRCGSSAVRRYQYFPVLLQFLYTSKREHFFDGDLISYPHVVPSVRLGFYILPALGPSGQLYAITRL